MLIRSTEMTLNDSSRASLRISIPFCLLILLSADKTTQQHLQYGLLAVYCDILRMTGTGLVLLLLVIQ